MGIKEAILRRVPEEVSTFADFTKKLSDRNPMEISVMPTIEAGPETNVQQIRYGLKFNAVTDSRRVVLTENLKHIVRDVDGNSYRGNATRAHRFTQTDIDLLNYATLATAIERLNILRESFPGVVVNIVTAEGVMSEEQLREEIAFMKEHQIIPFSLPTKDN